MSSKELLATIKFASRNGDVKVVERLLATGVDPSAQDNEAIQIASENGHVKVVELLLKDPRVDPSANENYAIRIASESGHFEVVELLLKDPRVDPSAVDDEPWRNAYENGHLEIVELLEREIRRRNEENKQLLTACSDGDIDAVNRLLKDGVDPSENDNNAIVVASENGHVEVVDRLLKDPRVDPSENDNNAIQIASENGHVEVVDRLLKDPRVDPSANGNNAIVGASANGHVEVVDLLLKNGADPSADKNVAIIFASANGHVEVVDRLLKDPRVNPSARNNKAIVKAYRMGHLDVVKLLISDPRVDTFPLLMDAVKENLAGEKIDILIKNRDLVPRILEQFNANPVNRNYPDVQDKLKKDIQQRSRTKTCEIAENVVEMSEYKIMDYLNVTVKAANTDDDSEPDDQDLTDYEKEVERNKRIIFFLGESIENLLPYATTLNFLLYSLHNSLYSTDCKKNRYGEPINSGYESDMKDAIFLLKFGVIHYPVYLTNLIQALRTNKKVFVVLPLFDEKGDRINVERTAGIAQLGNSNLLGIDPNTINNISADHCQAGTDKKLYGVYACEGEGDNPLYPVCHRDA